MNLQNPFRAELGGVSNWINEAFDTFAARINAIWNVQHKGDGTHAAVTADTLALGADPSDGSWAGNVGSSLVPSASTYDLGATVTQGAGKVGDHPWRNLRLSGDIIWANYSDSGTTQAGVPRLTRTLLNHAYTSQGVVTFALASGANTHTVTMGKGLNALESTNDIKAGLNFYELGRTTPLGYWLAVAFNAANFTGSGSLTWTLTSGDQTDFRYTLIGKTMIVKFAFDSTSTGGVASFDLRVTIPGGFTAATFALNPVRVVDNAGPDTFGFAYVSASGTTINFRNNGSANWSAASANNTSVEGELTFEIV